MKVHGLILAGGKSSRLGYDKAHIKWHGIPQYQYLVELLQSHCEEVVISTNHPARIQQGYKILPDRIAGLGPIGGIHAALSEASSPWLVIPTDLPLITNRTITKLINESSPNVLINYGQNTVTGKDEPLVSLWQPLSLPDVESQIEAGNYSIQSVLNTVTGHRIPLDGNELINVNKKGDYYLVKSQLPYVPIDRNFFNYIKVAASLAGKVKICYYKSNQLRKIHDRIEDVRNQHDSEELLLKENDPIRLDLLVSINDESNPII